jgi:NAD(P)-dependent dehydrogenase (short-subunit alcohol dehydrogenase family)
LTTVDVGEGYRSDHKPYGEERVESNLQGKTVLVTEATRNFGHVTAQALAREGANLFLSTLDHDEQLESIRRDVSELGAKVATGRYDISDEAQAQAMVERCIAEFGRLEVVVNNALFPVPTQSLEALTFEQWKRKIEVETTGPFYLFKHVLPRMIEQRWGRIINYTGLDAFKGEDVLAGATELGIVGLTRGIAREYGKHQITANCIGAGGIETEDAEGRHAFPPGQRDPIPRWGRPEEIAFLTVSLCSEEAGYVTGQCLLANGGKYFL